MIDRISIRDFAVIRETEAELYPGLSVITGETGSGKSVVIEALSLALGSRADRTMVRVGAGKARIDLVTSGSPGLFSREISAAGKSLARMDGEIVTLAELQKSAAPLVDIHGQYDHQSLLDPETHIGVLDAFGTDHLKEPLLAVSSAYSAYRETEKSLNELLKSMSLSARETDYMKYEMKEIDEAKPIPGEDAELSDRIAMMKGSEKIFAALSKARELIDGDFELPALAAVGEASDALAGIGGLTEELGALANAVKGAYYDIQEASEQIRAISEKMDFSPSDLDVALSRLDLIDRLKSKYGGDIERVLAHRDECESRLNRSENFETEKEQLEKELSEKREAYRSEAAILSELRQTIAARLEKEITEQLVDLNFMDASFSVRLKTDENLIAERGNDIAEFLLSGGKGQPVMPLASVASGGELSRIMLALKSVTSEYDGIETLIFDEIDSGISGVTAAVVGEKLRKMSKKRQIICITHLPQIAASADHHYVIDKNTDGPVAETTLSEVDGEARIEAVARLLGGRSLTDAALKNARELIEISSD
ncbi:MAG: DNA repair protein RecN [Clostridiales Family XIII bacterium]|jgi:DNA repair protein RecN (Recombination protein N)|nr:DNA repair protein RecN [Clostridiales Family XIII bacterium]